MEVHYLLIDYSVGDELGKAAVYFAADSSFFEVLHSDVFGNVSERALRVEQYEIWNSSERFLFRLESLNKLCCAICYRRHGLTITQTVHDTQSITNR